MQAGCQRQLRRPRQPPGAPVPEPRLSVGVPTCAVVAKQTLFVAFAICRRGPAGEIFSPIPRNKTAASPRGHPMARGTWCARLLALSGVVSLASCGSDPAEPRRIPAVIVIIPNAPRIPQKATKQLTATVVD